MRIVSWGEDVKTIIFGVGNYYQKRKNELARYEQIEIVAFSDNNNTLWGEFIDGFQVISPESIINSSFDNILIMSTHEESIFSQLIQLGIEESKILFWELFRSKNIQGKRELFRGKDSEKLSGRKILIILHDLDYHGAAIVSVYAALAMQSRGYKVVLSAPEGSIQFIDEITEKGISVVVCPALPYVYDREKEWIREFDLLIVNVLPMMQSAYVCSGFIPTLWWIHEAKDFYKRTLSKPWNTIEEQALNRLNIYAVSNLAKDNFNTLFADRIQKILGYGIPDFSSEDVSTRKEQSKIIFAIIGNVCERKAQDIFLEAALQLEHREQADFWIIGNCPDDAFGRKIKKMVRNVPTIKMQGVLSREEIYNIFPQIDVVVCASREDPLPITMTEGMMFGKVCITTDKTGTVDFIKNGVNGFTVPAENVCALKEKLQWIMNNREKLKAIGANARKTYENYFSMEAFGERLEAALIETERKWEKAGEK